MSEESGQSAELNSDHGDIDPGFGAGLGGFVIAHQSPLAHEPTEGSFHDPAARQHFEADHIVGAFDDLDHQLGAQPLDPLGERFAGVAAIHPQDAEPSEPAQDPTQNHLCPVTFRGVSWGHGHAEHQPQGVHQQMALTTFDPLAGVIANAPAVTVGLHTLAVENGGRRSAAFALGFADEGAEHVVEHCPLMVERPLPEPMVDGLPRRKIRGEITPRAATFDDIQDGIHDASPVNGRSSAFGALGEHRLEVSPLGIRETGLIYGVFHAPTEAALKIGRRRPSPMSTHPCTIRPLTTKQTIQIPSRNPKNLIIQTATKDNGAVGRIPYLVPVTWKDGWPVLGEDGKVPMTLDIPAGGQGVSGVSGIVASDEFDRQPGAPALPLAWQWNHNPDNKLWSVTQRPGLLKPYTTVDATLYTNLTFWINGGATGGQNISVYGELNGSSSGLPTVSVPAPTNSWKQVTISLTALGVNKTNLTGIGFNNGASTNPFFIDDMRLIAAPKPAAVHVSVNANQTVRTAIMRFDEDMAEILRDLPGSGSLFPYLRTVRAGDRATEFRQRCAGLKIKDVTLHSYRYAWAERAKYAGYPERFAQAALGHNSKAVHRAYAKRALVKIPSLEDYEERTIPMFANRETRK
jgi:Beta xylosidase C-terminal Concanavalin A-like domain